MPRQKLSEYRAKKIIAGALAIEYRGWPLNSTQTNLDLNESERYVVKIDQAVKGRFKKGLVALDVSAGEIPQIAARFSEQGYSSFIIEPYVEHTDQIERYLVLTKTATGITIGMSRSGGVDIESNQDSIITVSIDGSTDWERLAAESAIGVERLKQMIDAFESNHMTFLEINPYIVEGDTIQLLDLAIEIDDTAQDLVSGWTKDDICTPPRVLSDEELAVAQLASTSPASFSLQMIHPNAGLFVLLSGGGASVVIADEIYSAGLGEQLANYGEYSGNPTEEETYVYAAALLRAVIRSTAPKKAIFIGGAVANFTDVAKTFAGIIRAFDEYADNLALQQVKVVVRRGGPHQEKGLKNIRNTLEAHGLLGAVYDQKTPINEAVRALIKEIR